MEKKTEYVSQAGHWYKKDGTPAYTVIGKNGERPTTLRDARKLGFVPSVTTILALADKPALNAWKEDKILMSALTCPHNYGESNDDWVKRIKADAKEQSEKARARGTQIHGWLEQAFGGKTLPEAVEYAVSVSNSLTSAGIMSQTFSCEKSFANDKFGGKVDLHNKEEGIIIDIKTKDTSLEGIKVYDEHAMQLSAYRHGLSLPDAKCGILYVSTLDKTSKLVWVEEKDLQRGWGMFESLLEFWYHKTGLKEAI